MSKHHELFGISLTEHVLTPVGTTLVTLGQGCTARPYDIDSPEDSLESRSWPVCKAMGRGAVCCQHQKTRGEPCYYHIIQGRSKLRTIVCTSSKIAMFMQYTPSIAYTVFICIYSKYDTPSIKKVKKIIIISMSSISGIFSIWVKILTYM